LTTDGQMLPIDVIFEQGLQLHQLSIFPTLPKIAMTV
jgi:hypothetical protein